MEAQIGAYSENNYKWQGQIIRNTVTASYFYSTCTVVQLFLHARL